ncbi:helix-turn-helix domain-containing protein [Chryseobacterium taihuense]|uniref:Helix-turn-helix n=1 Tax=Chryseobacterium taihuense TaxID=1141221 RepID=A0ABY0QV99_9FLAO|nr:helix-turn-helix transcriptional regulator [Chryseobacterium taihuense]SDL96233.1 Helix-turn-helix [Chryseobacterium taihuense]
MRKEKLYQARKKKGITQNQLANILSTDVSNYCRKESGDVKITKSEWEKIAKFLDVSFDDIYEEDENIKVVINADNNSNGENFGNYNNYYNIPNSLIENLQDYIKLLKEENRILKEKLNM